MVAEWVHDLLAPGRELHEAGGGVVSAIAIGERGSPYDRQARAYDRVIGSRIYNRLVWQTSPDAYAAFSATAVADADGRLLDVGCGTALFTAMGYRASARRLVLVDRSLSMLAGAAERLDDTDTERVCLLQADLFDLPFVPGSFATVACHGLLHLFDDPARLLRILRTQAMSNGSVYASSLLAETPLGRRVLQLLHSTGEAAVPRREQELSALAQAALGDDVQLRREGAMAFLHTPTESRGAS